MYSDHYYPMDSSKVVEDAALVKASNKVGIERHFMFILCVVSLATGLCMHFV